MKKIILFLSFLLCFIILYGQEKKNIKEQITINLSKANNTFFENINDEIPQLKFLSFDKSKNTYYYTGIISVYYYSKGSLNTSYTINKSHSITNSGNKENAGHFSFNFSIQIKNNIAYLFSNEYIHFGNGVIGSGGAIEGYPECGSEKIGGIPNWELYKKQAEEETLLIIDKIKKLLY